MNSNNNYRIVILYLLLYCILTIQYNFVLLYCYSYTFVNQSGFRQKPLFMNNFPIFMSLIVFWPKFSFKSSFSVFSPETRSWLTRRLVYRDSVNCESTLLCLLYQKCHQSSFWKLLIFFHYPVYFKSQPISPEISCLSSLWVTSTARYYFLMFGHTTQHIHDKYVNTAGASM